MKNKYPQILQITQTLTAELAPEGFKGVSDGRVSRMFTSV